MGSKHYFNILDSAKKILTKKEFEKALISIEFNSFWAHSESILLCAANDPDLSVRKKGIDLILKARQQNDSTELRKFSKPKKININAKHYFDLLNPDDQLTEPPILKIYTSNRLKKCAAGNDLPLPNLICHSTNTERAIKNTTYACATVIGEDRRHEFLLNLAENRAKININIRPSKKYTHDIH